MKRFVVALLCVVWVSVWPSEEAVTRVAIDIGSAGFKVTAAELLPVSGQVLRIFYQKEHPVPLKRDLLRHGTGGFSQEVQDQAYAVLTQVKAELAHLGDVPWRGIATAASRQSNNAEQMYARFREELGVDIRIVPQEEEGRIGHLTAKALSGAQHERFVAYDSGSGSFQISSAHRDTFEVLEGKVGYIPVLATLIEEIRGAALDASSSPNPVSVHEARELVRRIQPRLPQPSADMAALLADPEVPVYGIGNDFFIFAYGAVGVGKNPFTRQELWQAIERHSDLEDSQLHGFGKAEEALVGMIFLYSVMESLDIPHLQHVYANGCCEGVLIDESYWN